MNERVRAFLVKKQQEEFEQNIKERTRTLLELGLYEKVYSPTDTYDEEYYMYEWDAEECTAKYYKIVPIEVTDEEYQEVKKYKNSVRYNGEDTDKNTVATILTVIAWITFICGFISGIVFGNMFGPAELVKEYGEYEIETEFSWFIAFLYWTISFLSGMMFIGFAEIIKLLNAIKNKKEN